MAQSARPLSRIEQIAHSRDGRGVDLRGEWLVDANLCGVDLSGADLRECDLSRADLRGAILVGADLRGAILFEARLAGAEFMGARLQHANLAECQGKQAGFGKAQMNGVTLVGANLERATLTGAILDGADLRGTALVGARLRECSLVNTELANANLSEADLTDAAVHSASFRRTDLQRARLGGMRGYQEADWVGADLRNADFVGAYLLQRFVLDQNFLAEFQQQGPMNKVLYGFWKATSDCGRSLSRWALWTLFVALAYAGLYAGLEMDYGAYETALSPVYFSVVTLTTLGYGDAVPMNNLSQAVVTSQVLLGYFMLGGLLSICAAKMSRRGG